MSYVIERLDRFGDAIWYFPGGIAAMLAVYFLFTYAGRKRSTESIAEPGAGAQSSRLGCVWTLLSVYVVVWVLLILRS